jgi:hypothetical protein
LAETQILISEDELLQFIERHKEISPKCFEVKDEQVSSLISKTQLEDTAERSESG